MMLFLKPIALGAIGDALSETNKVDDAILLQTSKQLKFLKMILLHRYCLKQLSYIDCRKKKEANKVIWKSKKI